NKYCGRSMTAIEGKSPESAVNGARDLQEFPHDRDDAPSSLRLRSTCGSGRFRFGMAILRQTIRQVIDKAGQRPALCGLLQFSNCLSFNLPNAFSSDREDLPYFFQSIGIPVD